MWHAGQQWSSLRLHLALLVFGNKWNWSELLKYLNSQLTSGSASHDLCLGLPVVASFGLWPLWRHHRPPQDCRVKASSWTCVSACLPLLALACGHCGGITVPPKTVVLMHQAGLVSRLACRCFLWLVVTVEASPSPQDCRVKASSRTCVSACLPLLPLPCDNCGCITVPPQDCRVKSSSRTCVSACLPLLPLPCGHCGCITVPPPPRLVLRHQAGLVSRLACRCILWLAATVDASPSPPKTVVLTHQSGLVSRLACRCFLWLATTVDASPSPQDCRVKASSQICVSACLRCFLWLAATVDASPSRPPRLSF